MKIQVKYHDKELMPLEVNPKGDYIDLRSAEDVFIPLDRYKLISLGVSMVLPKGYSAVIVPRSSTFKNFGIIQTNHMGVIDESYCGENDIWHFPAFCLEGRGIKKDDLGNNVIGTWIHKNDRICQFRLEKKQEPIEFETVEKTGCDNRGGIGSTGVQ